VPHIQSPPGAFHESVERVLVSSKPIVHPRDGTVVGTFDASGGVGTGASQKLPAGAKYAAVLYQDAAGNWGHLAGVKLP